MAQVIRDGSSSQSNNTPDPACSAAGARRTVLDDEQKDIMTQTILTKEGFEKLQKELLHLKGRKRIEAAKHLEEARALGDLRENSEYETAKHEKSKLEARIQALENKLANAKIVDKSEVRTDKIFFGTMAELKNLKTGDKVTFSFVAADEADIAQGKIAITSPIGQALLGHKVGDKVDVKAPAGVIPYQVLKIKAAE
ncbi:MAG: transcription elongation factor GreA [Candidatus Omnitrophica bacterium CG11_big_fil_rev_8_21_14_0_20_45_26]|uniref:Transcription elongation factor GreA n=1 Tax=Candidatus Abzuiibacterium crystallinum TaxID=1974748 RepID=A0A2H0LT33_9BACT|nr:MAG: transcription elongation factor GreA [Candidatus Omnitrophica bacterium CG11_big_fil_rev_8_21_14_0_20_45_26]PIW65735.1 MAG: transcription elongation factor GreA [Candidatus Omnitrophica bacterium CG12_big_fil_rev_8_21_14_0_65_45_16]